MKNQKGITLIVLIITIIVMMILVAVSVTIALDSGLFKSAQSAAKRTETERANELGVANGQVFVDGQEYTSMQHYVDSLKGGTGSSGTENEEPGKMITITFSPIIRPFDVREGDKWKYIISSLNEEFRENGCGNEGCYGESSNLFNIGNDEGYDVIWIDETNCSCKEIWTCFGVLVLNGQIVSPEDAVQGVRYDLNNSLFKQEYYY